MDFSFLKSIRFWKIVGAAVVWGLLQAGILPPAVADPIIAVLIGSVAVRTVDRSVEKLGGE